MEQLRVCPMRVSTIVFHMGNNRDWYDAANDGDFSFLEEFGFTDADAQEMIQKWESAQDQDQDDEGDNEAE
jgi:hypothetical protein